MAIKNLFLFLFLFSFKCIFAQIDNYLTDDIYSHCDKKCYVIIKIPDVIYKESKDDSMVNAKINEESRMWLKESISKKITIANRSQLDTIKYCNSSVLIINIDGYTKKSGNIGLAASAVNVKFVYFEKVNNDKPDKEIEVVGIGEALWGDLNVFVSAYVNAVKQFNDISSPKKFKIKPVANEYDSPAD